MENQLPATASIYMLPPPSEFNPPKYGGEKKENEEEKELCRVIPDTVHSLEGRSGE